MVDVADAIDDYLESTRLLAPFADYLAVNVSSPNTPGLRGLQELDQLRPLLTAVRDAAGRTPVLVKIAPDLTDEQIDAIAALAVELGLAGCDRQQHHDRPLGAEDPRGRRRGHGRRGTLRSALAARSLEVLRRVRAAVPEDFCVIAVGGVTSERDVQDRIDAGATLVQGYTAFLYEGPTWAARINHLRRRRLRRAAR